MRRMLRRPLRPRPYPYPYLYPYPYPMNQQTLLPADVCIEALVIAGGNTYLAAERLFGNAPEAVANLVASIAQDPLAQESLNAQLRTLTTLRAFDALTQTSLLLPAVLSELEAPDFVKFHASLLKQVSDLTSAQINQPNPADAITRLIQALPPDARRAFLTLVTTSDDSISDTVGRHEFALDGSADPTTANDVQPDSSTGSEDEAA